MSEDSATEGHDASRPGGDRRQDGARSTQATVEAAGRLPAGDRSEAARVTPPPPPRQLPRPRLRLLIGGRTHHVTTGTSRF